MNLVEIVGVAWDCIYEKLRVWVHTLDPSDYEDRIFKPLQKRRAFGPPTYCLDSSESDSLECSESPDFAHIRPEEESKEPHATFGIVVDPSLSDAENPAAADAARTHGKHNQVLNMDVSMRADAASPERA